MFHSRRGGVILEGIVIPFLHAGNLDEEKEGFRKGRMQKGGIL